MIRALFLAASLVLTACAAPATEGSSSSSTTTGKRAPKGPSATATRITEGTWTVGEDFRPGTYRVAEPVGELGCYWEIKKAGADDLDSIVANDAVTGGRPKVTLRKKGQEFKNQGCGVFVRTGD